MTTPFVGEIRMFGGSFAPRDWALCNGQPMAISQYSTLFSLMGTTFGGDGQQTFNLPNLQGRLPIGQGQGLGLTDRIEGQVGGVEGVTLTQSTMASHNHPYVATTATATSQTFAGMLSAAAPTGQYMYTATTAGPTIGTFAGNSVGLTGGNLPHENRMPSVCVSYIVALYGVYPSRN